MNETKGNARTKPMRGGVKGGEINSLKDSEKTNEYKLLCNKCFNHLYCIRTKKHTCFLGIKIIHPYGKACKHYNQNFIEYFTSK